MSFRNRLILQAINNETDSIVDADIIFKTSKEGHKVRKEYNRNKKLFICRECNQYLIVATNENDTIHFRHHAQAEYCSLISSNFSHSEYHLIKRHFVSKESERHIFLKNEIGRKLKPLEGVKKSSISIDDSFISIGKSRRKPDVFCEFNEHKIVFEIQLSKLPLSYILEREDFYRTNGYYLIWILDDFDVQKGQRAMEKDLKYLHQHQNFFKLNEDVEEFSLICEYKYPDVIYETDIYLTWLEASISLRDLKFDTNTNHAYYYNYEVEYAKLEDSIAKRKLEEEERESLAIREEWRTWVSSIVTEIKERSAKKSSVWKDLEVVMSEMDEDDIEELNIQLGFSDKEFDGIPILICWMAKISLRNASFIRFILSNEIIDVDVSRTAPDGHSILSTFFKKAQAPSIPYGILESIFIRGYRMKPIDWDTLKANGLDEIDYDRMQFKLRCYDLFNRDKGLIMNFIKGDIMNALLVVESIKQNRPMGNGLENWTAYLNNALHQYGQCWPYFKRAFIKYWNPNEYITLGNKGSVHNKIYTIENSKLGDIDLFTRYIRILYPELMD